MHCRLKPVNLRSGNEDSANLPLFMRIESRFKRIELGRETVSSNNSKPV
jgi:hypothetical protein